jgi:hypothetical protein
VAIANSSFGNPREKFDRSTYYKRRGILMNMNRLSAIWAGLILSATMLTAAPAQADKFTIGVISDTQNYVDITLPQPRGVDTFVQQMQYLADTKAEKNLVFATQVGDYVQHGDGQFRTGNGTTTPYVYYNTEQEWIYADRAMSILTDAKIPFGIALGNHDFQNYSWYPTNLATGVLGPGASRPLIGYSPFDKYVGPESKHYKNQPHFGGFFEGNSYQKFQGGGINFINIALEMEPKPSSLAWAQSVIDANPGVPTIVTTHEWMDPNFRGSIARSNDYNAYFAGTEHQTPDQVWDKFIRKNDQIFMVLAGHDFTPTPGRPGISNGEIRRTDRNDFGHEVYQLVSDYQGNTRGVTADGTEITANGGAGWMRFMEFDTDTKQIHFYTYSTLLGRYAGRNGESTFGAAPDNSDFYLPFTPQILAAQARSQAVPEPDGILASLISTIGVVVAIRYRRDRIRKDRSRNSTT